MAKAGNPSRLGTHAGIEGTATRSALTEAAVVALREEGFSGASARAIARTAGVNQALVFYHFGSVANLLLAALDETSRLRMDRYAEAVEAADGLAGLADVAADIFRQDLDGGHLAVLAEMIAGSSAVEGLGVEVAARVAPWIEFTERAVTTALGDSPLAGILPAGDVAYAIVALYLGIEMLANLDGDRSRAESLFATAGQLAAAVAGIGASFAVTASPTPQATTKEPTP